MRMEELRKKALLGLECCMDGRCQECPYYPPGCGGTSDDVPIRSAVIQDVLAALAALEPRVLTLEDALEADVCWLEIEGSDRVPPCRIGGGVKCVTIRRFDQVPEAALLDEYGKLFRCWSARPTEEQRKAAPWNNQQGKE